MHVLYERIASALGGLWRKVLSDEDPEERRKRLREEALKEIDAGLRPILKLRFAMQEWERDLKKDRESEASRGRLLASGRDPHAATTKFS